MDSPRRFPGYGCLGYGHTLRPGVVLQASAGALVESAENTVGHVLIRDALDLKPRGNRQYERSACRDAEEEVDEGVKLRGAKNRVRNAAFGNDLLGNELPLVVAIGNPVDSHDRNVQEMSDAGITGDAHQPLRALYVDSRGTPGSRIAGRVHDRIDAINSLSYPGTRSEVGCSPFGILRCVGRTRPAAHDADRVARRQGNAYHFSAQVPGTSGDEYSHAEPRR